MEHVVQTDVDRYVIVEYLAEGGMGAIFLGKKIGMGGFEKEVVLKQLLPEFTSQPEFIDLFLREAKLSAALDHANIVHTIDLVKAGSDYFIVMEYVRGGDLRTILRRIKHRGFEIEPAAAIYIGREVLSALAYAHDKKSADGVPLKLIHRDVSPSNIMVSAAGEVKLADFGIAKASTHKSVFYRVKGKVGYMSPEQAYGDPLDLRSDLYSIAVCLHEMLSGERLFVADLLSTPDQIYSQPIPKLEGRHPAIPHGLDLLMAKALAFSPDDRHQSALEFQEALVQVAYESAMLFSAPDLAAHLREICGDDPSTWNKEPDEVSEEGEGRPGTEVLAEEASAQFSGVELTSIFTGLPELLGPEPAANEATRHLRVEQGGIAYAPTRLRFDDLAPGRDRRAGPTFDFSDLHEPQHDADLEDSDNITHDEGLDPSPAPPRRERSPAPRRSEWREPSDDPLGWSGARDQDATVALDEAAPAYLPPHEENREAGEGNGHAPVERRGRREHAPESRGRDGRPRPRAESRDRERASEAEEREPFAARHDPGVEGERGGHRRGEAASGPGPSGTRKGHRAPGTAAAKPPVVQRSSEWSGEAASVPGASHGGGEPEPAPPTRGKSRTLDSTRRKRDASLFTEQVREVRRPRKTQRLVLLIVALLLLGAGVAIVALVGLTGPSLDDLGKGSKKDPVLIPPPPSDAARVRSAPFDDAGPGSVAASPDRGLGDSASERVSEGRGNLKVTSTPARAAVYLDNVFQCDTPCTIEELRDGRVYLLSIRRKNYVSWSSLVDLGRRPRLTVNAFLTEEPDSHRVGYLRINSSPVADVLVDGKRIGRVTTEGRIPLPPGQYEITLSHPHRTARPRYLVVIFAGQTALLSAKKF